MTTTVSIGTKVSGRDAWLTANAAAAYKRMVMDGCPRGCITDAGRTNAEQWEMWRKYLRGELEATAAYPGTSKHETGRALDLREPARSWVRQHGAAYGWQKDRVKNEPWHFEYEADTDQHRHDDGEEPEPEPPQEEPDMVIVKDAGSPNHYLVGPYSVELIGNTDYLSALATVYPAKVADAAQITRLRTLADDRRRALVTQIAKAVPAGGGSTDPKAVADELARRLTA